MQRQEMSEAGRYLRSRAPLVDNRLAIPSAMTASEATVRKPTLTNILEPKVALTNPRASTPVQEDHGELASLKKACAAIEEQLKLSQKENQLLQHALEVLRKEFKELNATNAGSRATGADIEGGEHDVAEVGRIPDRVGGDRGSDEVDACLRECVRPGTRLAARPGQSDQQEKRQKQNQHRTSSSKSSNVSCFVNRCQRTCQQPTRKTASINRLLRSANCIHRSTCISTPPTAISKTTGDPIISASSPNID